MNLNPVVWFATVVLAVGGINWALVGLFEFDLVAWLFGEEFGETNTMTRIVYALVGASALVTLIGLVSAQTKVLTGSGSKGQTRLTSN
jgi:uncharacterized membrane protein YuzA (DUF378 family)